MDERYPFTRRVCCFSEYSPCNNPDKEALYEKYKDQEGRLLLSDVEDTYKYADVTETVYYTWLGIRVSPKFARRVRVFRCVFTPHWNYMETGMMTPSLDIEKMEVAYQARVGSLKYANATEWEKKGC